MLALHPPYVAIHWGPAFIAKEHLTFFEAQQGFGDAGMEIIEAPEECSSEMHFSLQIPQFAAFRQPWNRGKLLSNHPQNHKITKAYFNDTIIVISAFSTSLRI